MNAEGLLPPGWAWSSIGDYLLNHDSVRIPLKESDRAIRPGEYLYYGASGPIDTIDDYLFDGEYLLIAEDGANLLSRAKPIAFRAKGRFWVNNHAHVVTTDSSVPLGFVEHMLNSMDVSGFVTGSAQPKLPQGAMSRIRLPIAPAAEQRRIVDVLDSYLTRLDAAGEGLKRAQANLQRYRAATLKAAVEGRLVAAEADLAQSEKRDFEPGTDLLRRILVERKQRWEASGRRGRYEEPVGPETKDLPPLPRGWCWASISQLADDTLIGLVRGRSEQRSSDSEGVPYLKMDSIRLDGALECDNLPLVDASPMEVARYSLRPGDLLFNTRNSVELVGKTALVRGPVGTIVFNNNIMRIRLSPQVSSRFVAEQCLSSLFRDQIAQVRKATTSVAAVYGRDLMRCAVALPPRDEQERIASAVEECLSVVGPMGAAVTVDIARIGRLRQSILKWAFEGKLVDQDPRDEPASILLDRIRRGRVAAAEKANVSSARARKTA